MKGFAIIVVCLISAALSFFVLEAHTAIHGPHEYQAVISFPTPTVTPK